MQRTIIDDNGVVFNNYLFSRCPNFSQNVYIMLLTTIREGGNIHPITI
jgi:hypothetical protein